MSQPLSASRQDVHQNEAQLRRQAHKRVELKLGFLTHLLVFACVNGGLFLLPMLQGSDGRWQGLPFWAWGLGLLIHGLVTLFALQGGDLRERLMAAELKALRERAGG